MCSVENIPVFRDLTADDPDPEVTEIESLCMNCHKNGITRLLLTRIPHYKNVVIMSFSCEECGYANNEIQPGGAYDELGVRWKLRVETPSDLNRQVVKSDYTRIYIPEVEFEVPSQSQKGEVTTVEGIVSRAIAGLSQDQTARRSDHSEAASQIDEFVEKLQRLKAGDIPWTLELTDISGNTYVENPCAPGRDPRCERTDFKRTSDEDHTLGIFQREEVCADPSPPSAVLSPADPALGGYDQMALDEVIMFRTNCPDCNAPADTHMKLTQIPYFKQVIIMATTCDACGHRTNEVKSGSGIEDKGVRFEVRLATKEDLSRDILKSETCSMEIPELELSVGGCALGGRFTTAEGLLAATGQQLAAAPGALGDAPGGAKDNLERFIEQLGLVTELQLPVTIILDDPAGNSYVQSFNDEDPTKPDDGLKITWYERSFEQNEDLGLNDMKVEGYEEDT